MRRGHTLLELVVTLTLMALAGALAYPRLRGWLDWVAVQRSATELTTALAVTRSTAILRAIRARLEIRQDSLRLDGWENQGWVALGRWPGPEQHGVRMAVSNPFVTFGAIGLGWETANTGVVLTKGLQSATITTSRLGRVKRW